MLAEQTSAAPAGSIRLRATLKLVAPALRASSAGLWHPVGLRERYAVYLRTMHSVTVASVPLMELAARRCGELGPRDAVAIAVRGYLERHVEEERGHDEWIRQDLRALADAPNPGVGGDSDRSDESDESDEPGTPPEPSMPSIAVARLVGAQYYWVEHHHPATVLGYIAVMESAAPRPGVADWIIDSAGVPPGAVRTVREHAELDTDHVEELFAVLDSLPLTPGQTQAVAVSGLHTAHSLIDLYDHIRSVAEREYTGPTRTAPTPGEAAR